MTPPEPAAEGAPTPILTQKDLDEIAMWDRRDPAIAAEVRTVHEQASIAAQHDRMARECRERVQRAFARFLELKRRWVEDVQS